MVLTLVRLALGSAWIDDVDIDVAYIADAAPTPFGIWRNTAAPLRSPEMLTGDPEKASTDALGVQPEMAGLTSTLAAGSASSLRAQHKTNPASNLPSGTPFADPRPSLSSAPTQAPSHSLTSVPVATSPTGASSQTRSSDAVPTTTSKHAPSPTSPVVRHHEDSGVRLPRGAVDIPPAYSQE